MVRGCPRPWDISPYVGYFLSPFDFLNELLTFFFFKAAFNRFVLPRFFMPPPRLSH